MSPGPGRMTIPFHARHELSFCVNINKRNENDCRKIMFESLIDQILCNFEMIEIRLNDTINSLNPNIRPAINYFFLMRTKIGIAS